MRVLFLNDFASVRGGADAAAIASAVAVSDAGLDVAFFGGAGQPDGRARSLRHMAPGLPSVHEDGSRLDQLRRGLWHREARRQVSLFLDRHVVPNETVIHLHSFTKVLSPCVLQVLSARKLPVVVTLHDYFLFCPNGNYFNFPQSVPCALEPLSAQCCLSNCDSRGPATKAVRLARAGILAATGGRADSFRVLIAVSQASACLVRRLAPSAPVRVVRNLLPAPDAAHTTGNRDGVVYVGRLTRSKGVVVLAAAARAAGVPVVFVGDGEARREVLAVNPSAVITGWVPADQTRTHISAAKALVLPSLWQETFGQVVAEALALGRPVIVSDRAGAAELVVEGTNGFVWRADAQEGLEVCLAQIVRQDTYPKLEAGAGQTYRSSWATPGKHAEELLAVYGEAIGAPSGGCRAAVR